MNSINNLFLHKYLNMKKCENYANYKYKLIIQKINTNITNIFIHY